MIIKNEDILDVLWAHWQLKPSKFESLLSTPRLFKIEVGCNTLMVRLNFDRPSLSANTVIAFIDYLSKEGCSVPRIIPTIHGTLCYTSRNITFSVESELPGNECDSESLDVLYSVGSGLATIHVASQEFSLKKAKYMPLLEFTRSNIERVLARNLVKDERTAVSELFDNIMDKYRDKLEISIPWLINHGDVRCQNILLSNNEVRFTDIYSIFAPALADVVLVKDRWLLGDPLNQGRHLRSDEFTRFLDGYKAVRPFTTDECETFGIIWGVCLAEKLTHYTVNHNKIKDVRVGFWKFHEEILNLPQVVEDMISIGHRS